jgi:ERCC4-type nuclease
MSIIVDPRVGSKHMIEPLRRRVMCRVKLAKPMLNSGDVCFSGNGPTGEVMIGIEIKKLRDFLGSMRSDRMAGDQIVKMSEDYAMVFVIVEGLWKPGPNDALMARRGKDWQPLDLAAKESGGGGGFKYGEMFKHMVSLNLRKNVMLLVSHSEDETATQIAHLYAWFQRDWDAHNSTDPVKLQCEVTFARVSLLRKMAAELPGIGWTRSKTVERAFISVQQMVNASVEQWESLDGIGAKTARRVWSALREKAL